MMAVLKEFLRSCRPFRLIFLFSKFQKEPGKCGDEVSEFLRLHDPQLMFGVVGARLNH